MGCLQELLGPSAYFGGFIATWISLPITSFKIDEESTITAETKFTAQFNVNCCTEEATDEFLRELQSITNTTYNIFTGDNRKLKSCIVVGTRKCQQTNVKRRFSH